MKKLYLFIMILGVLFAGCAQKKIVAPSENQQQPSPQQQITEQKDMKTMPSETGGLKVSKIESKDITSGTEGTKASKAEEAAGIFKDIYFGFDKYDIREDAKLVLKSVADYLIKNTGQIITIEGHCDERGTNEYNLALGEKRAKATRDYLVSAGVSKNRLDIATLGEERPFCKDHNEDCWQKNRRAHFVVK